MPCVCARFCCTRSTANARRNNPERRWITSHCRLPSAPSRFSAFFVYLFAAVLVFNGRLPYLPWWAQGMAVVMMLTVPLLFAFSGKERKAIPVVVFNALLFGFLISAAERYL